MATDLFTFVKMYGKVLVTAEHLLDQGAAHAKSLGLSAEDALGWRLIGDMHPLRFQIMVVCNFARQWPARVAGIEVPAPLDDQFDIAGFKAELGKARDYLAALTPEQFEGRDAVPVTFAISANMEPTLPAGRWLTGFATTNLYFHLSVVYSILRAKGTPIGKIDLFAGGL